MASPPLATEQIPPDEAHYINDLRKRLKAKIQREYPQGVMRRDAHPKMHGLVRAYFIVRAGFACRFTRRRVSGASQV